MSQNTPNTTNPANPKSPLVAYLLWFFLGGFGAHRFYCGRMKSGAGMAALMILSCLLTVVVIGVIGFPILGIWWIVDAFLIGGWLKETETTAATDQIEPPMSQAA